MTKTTEITNSLDVIDSRDIIERIKELKDTEDEDEKAELASLENLAEDCQSSEWTYGVGLIRDDYFTEYAKELCEDIGDLPKEVPNYIKCHIDWDGVTEDLKVDYETVDFDGVTYWFR